MVRKGWLRDGPGPAERGGRGEDGFVQMDGDEVLDRLAAELAYIGSYSGGASTFLLPSILGPFPAVTRRHLTRDPIVEHTQVVLAFGGLPLRAAEGGGDGATTKFSTRSLPSTIWMAPVRGCASIRRRSAQV